MFDIDNLKLKEIAKIEELSGQSIGSISDTTAPKGTALAALAFVIKRKQMEANGEYLGAFTWEMALDLTVNEANAVIGVDTAAPKAET